MQSEYGLYLPFDLVQPLSQQKQPFTEVIEAALLVDPKQRPSALQLQQLFKSRTIFKNSY